MYTENIEVDYQTDKINYFTCRGAVYLLCLMMIGYWLGIFILPSL
jgi:hypothetical protein